MPATFPHSVWAVFIGTAHGRPYAVIGLVLLVLIPTPVVRVVATLVGFIRPKDSPYIAITAIVLAVLLLSFALGKADYAMALRPLAASPPQRATSRLRSPHWYPIERNNTGVVHR